MDCSGQIEIAISPGARGLRGNIGNYSSVADCKLVAHRNLQFAARGTDTALVAEQGVELGWSHFALKNFPGGAVPLNIRQYPFVDGVVLMKHGLTVTRLQQCPASAPGMRRLDYLPRLLPVSCSDAPVRPFKVEQRVQALTIAGLECSIGQGCASTPSSRGELGQWVGAVLGKGEVVSNHHQEGIAIAARASASPKCQTGPAAVVGVPEERPALKVHGLRVRGIVCESPFLEGATIPGRVGLDPPLVRASSWKGGVKVPVHSMMAGANR